MRLAAQRHAGKLNAPSPGSRPEDIEVLCEWVAIHCGKESTKPELRLDPITE